VPDQRASSPLRPLGGRAHISLQPEHAQADVRYV
jgi:hypothetical protein